MQSFSDKIKESIDPIKQHIEGDGGSVEFIELTEDLIVRLKVSGSTKPVSYTHLTLPTIYSV